MKDWYCAHCGSDDLAVKIWYDLGNSTLGDFPDKDDPSMWYCNDCDCNTTVTEDPNEWKSWVEINKGEEKFERDNNK